MKEVYVGTYELGYERVRLFLREGVGANFYFMPDDKEKPLIKIGADENKWASIISNTLHEAMEFAMSRLGHRYFQSPMSNNSSADYHFMMNHEQFNECCSRSAEFLTPVLPTLSKAWKKWQAEAKKKGKKK